MIRARENAIVIFDYASAKRNEIKQMRKFDFVILFCGLFLSAANVHAAPCTEPGSMRRLYKQVSGGFEYVIFEFNKPASPPFIFRTAHPPFAMDGSGDRVRVKGTYFKEALFHGVMWTCGIRESLRMKTVAIRDVKKTGQFEGDVSYIIGYGRPGQYVSTYVRDTSKFKRYYAKFRR